MPGGPVEVAREMSGAARAGLILAFAYPAACTACAETAVILSSAGLDRPVAARFLGWLGIAEVVVAAALGTLIAGAVRGRRLRSFAAARRAPPGPRPEDGEAGTTSPCAARWRVVRNVADPRTPGPRVPGAASPPDGRGKRLAEPGPEVRRVSDSAPAESLRGAACAAVGFAIALSVLAVLPGGSGRLAEVGLTGAVPAIGLAGLAGCLAALARRATLSASRAGTALLVEPPALAAAIAGTHAALRRQEFPTASLRSIALHALAAGVVMILASLLGRARPRSPRSAVLAVSLVTVAGCGALLVVAGLGRRPFPHPGAGPEGPPDTVLIVLDTTRADFAPAPPGSRFPTPALARLSAEGSRWTEVFSTSCWTVPAHGSLFTGMLPSGHGASWSSPYLSPDVRTLAEAFAAAGRRTAGFSANPWISPEFGFDRGFGRFETGDADRRPHPPGLVSLFPRLFRTFDAPILFEDACGLTLVSGALAFLAEDDDRPAFVFINLLEPHLPYAPPRRYLDHLAGSGWDREELLALDQDRLRDLLPGARRTEREIQGLRLLYAAELAGVDHLVGGLLDALDRGGRKDRTIVAVTSDHGENLGQHPPLDHQLGLYDTLLRVPLIVRFPGATPPGATDDRLVSLAELPAKLLDLAGVPGAFPAPRTPEDRAQDAVFFEYDRPGHILELIGERLKLDPSPWDRSLAGARTRAAKWIEATDGRNQAYDLVSDPAEQHNLAEAGGVPPGFEPLARRVESLRQTERSSAPRPRRSLPGEEAEEKLRSLGYIH